MRSSSAGAKQVIDSLKKDIAKLQKDNRELTGQRQAFSQAMLLRDEKLTQWRHSYNNLAQEVAQLHTERVNLLDEKILPWHKDVDIEPSTVKPPKVEESELASGETLEDQLHGLSHDQLEIMRASRWVLKNKRKPPKDLTDVYSVFRGSDDDEVSQVASATMDQPSQVASASAGATLDQPLQQQLLPPQQQLQQYQQPGDPLPGKLCLI